MLRQGGGFFGKSRTSPVTSFDLKRSATGGVGGVSREETPGNMKFAGLPPPGSESATGGNMTPLGQPPPKLKTSNETPPSQMLSAQQTPPAKIVGESRGTLENSEGRDGTRPRKSVMRKVSACKFSKQALCLTV